jgi:hypothetical protein
MIDHISVSVLEDVAAPPNVGVPLDVAALGNVIGCVDVIDAVRRSDRTSPIDAIRTSQPTGALRNAIVDRWGRALARGAGDGHLRHPECRSCGRAA